ncbi:serotriflin-like [Achroia grisella]|uniref:serotriflin-like n=1 Tax=Achroia grisella TaxID=688607 RepID=UPI0027D21961|nr:serotriflin-like [Achroia grisella]
MSSKSALWIHGFLILNAVVTIDSLRTLDENKQLFSPNKIPDNALSPKRAIVRRKIILYHNFLRSKVRPSASNMLLMSWHERAARQAQRYAEQCVFLQHNDPSENTVPRLGSCGQNLFVAAQKTPWFFALKTWFLEYKNFTYGAPVHNLKAVGHYTQMVWATSHKLGCGLAHCPGGPWGHFYNYVCHYCPAGNIDTITQYPYKVGSPCGDCPHDCVSDELCANSCPLKDFYSNCDQLVGFTDICGQGYCNATCGCGDTKLYKNYPW